jgi:hypothetical protein
VDPGSFDAGEPIPVTLEDDDVSFLLTAVADDPEAFVAVMSITDPDGEVIYSLDENFMVSGPLTHNLLEDQGEVSVLAPAHPGLDVRPGTYEVAVNAPAEATVLIKSGEIAAEEPQFLDLNLWLVSSDLDVATLEQGLRSQIDQVLTNQNLSIGRVDVVNADPADVARFADLDDTQLADACTAMTAAVGENRSLDLAIVETLTVEGGQLLGISAGLPGSSPAPGVSKTCTIAATSGFDLETIASTIVHEGSHFMGLLHTSEVDGSNFDDFDDTPDCDVAVVDGRDNPDLGIPGTPDGEIDEAECGLGGSGANYMFPTSSGVFPQTDMTADQAWALRRHPLVYAAP